MWRPSLGKVSLHVPGHVAETKGYPWLCRGSINNRVHLIPATGPWASPQLPELCGSSLVQGVAALPGQGSLSHPILLIQKTASEAASKPAATSP